jgi:hypothetical protein
MSEAGMNSCSTLLGVLLERSMTTKWNLLNLLETPTDFTIFSVTLLLTNQIRIREYQLSSGMRFSIAHLLVISYS